jgi:hypothetical protein
MRLWRYQSPSRRDFVQAEEIFTAASYQYVLYGMGYAPARGDNRRRSENEDLARRYHDDNASLTRRLLKGLPTNRELLAGMGKVG